MKVVILAAGYAVRMHPLTLKTSKTLLAINGRKIIDRILDKIAALEYPVDSIYIVTNAKFFENFAAWLKKSKYRKRISIINDGTITNETRLGAIQDLEMAVKSVFINDDTLVIAGDNLFDFDINKFVKFAARNSNGVSVALHDVKDRNAAKNFGVVGIDADNRVVDFEEKPPDPKSTLISSGIYYFPGEKLSLIDEYVRMQSKLDAPGYYISWLSKVDKVYGFTFLEDWYDIGNIESYKKADSEYREKEKKA